MNHVCPESSIGDQILLDFHEIWCRSCLQLSHKREARDNRLGDSSTLFQDTNKCVPIVLRLICFDEIRCSGRLWNAVEQLWLSWKSVQWKGRLSVRLCCTFHVFSPMWVKFGMRFHTSCSWAVASVVEVSCKSSVGGPWISVAVNVIVLLAQHRTLSHVARKSL